MLSSASVSNHVLLSEKWLSQCGVGQEHVVVVAIAEDVVLAEAPRVDLVEAALVFDNGVRKMTIGSDENCLFVIVPELVHQLRSIKISNVLEVVLLLGLRLLLGLALALGLGLCCLAAISSYFFSLL